MKEVAEKKRRTTETLGNAREAFLSRLDAWRMQERNRSSWRRAWQTVVAPLVSLYGLVLKLPLVIAIVVILTVVAQGLVWETTVIEPISVPKLLIDNGYSPEVAARQLRDAIKELVEDAASSVDAPTVALHSELPNIIVPTVGISLDAVRSFVRTIFRNTRNRLIVGEITVSNDLLWLRWRIDGSEFFMVDAPVEEPEKLFAAAAKQIIEYAQPYLAAAALYNDDKLAAIKKADEIIDRLPKADDNVVWSYILKSSYHGELEEFDLSADCARVAIELNPALSAAHHNLAFALSKLGPPENALSEFETAISLDPRDPVTHTSFGIFLDEQGQLDKAIRHYAKAIRFNSKYALPHYRLGVALHKQEKFDEAISAYRKAIAIDPTDVLPHHALGDLFRDTRKKDMAIAEYKEALRLEPDSGSVKGELERLEGLSADPNAIVPAEPQADDAKSLSPRSLPSGTSSVCRR